MSNFIIPALILIGLFLGFKKRGHSNSRSAVYSISIVLGTVFLMFSAMLGPVRSDEIRQWELPKLVEALLIFMSGFGYILNIVLVVFVLTKFKLWGHFLSFLNFLFRER